MSSKTELTALECLPGAAPLGSEERERLLAGLSGWVVNHTQRLAKLYHFPDFEKALAFVNRIGALAEETGHHPDLHLSWGKVQIEIWTHSVDALTRGDFALAARCDQVAR